MQIIQSIQNRIYALRGERCWIGIWQNYTKLKLSL